MFANVMLTCVFSIAAVSAAQEVTMLRDIADLKWKNRVIIILDSDNAANDIDRLNAAKAAIDDRDIVWFVNDGETTTSNYQGKLKADFASYLRDAYNVEYSRLVYIGKDGGVKLRGDQLNLKDIFSLTDKMPMRRREMLEAH